MNFKKISLLAILAALVGFPQANAASLDVLGVGTYLQPKASGITAASPGDSLTSQMGLGFGLGIETSLASRLALEIDGLYVDRKYQDSGTASTSDSSFHAVQIPVLLRLKLLSFFSVGAGGYAAFATGNVSTATTVAGVTTTSTSTYAGDSLKTSDYGAVFSARFRIPLGAKAALLAEGRYNLGLSNISTTPGTTDHWRTVDGLAGLQFAF